MENSTINEKDQTQAWFFSHKLSTATLYFVIDLGEREREKKNFVNFLIFLVVVVVFVWYAIAL